MNVEIGRPFGFELQIDQDFDGGERDGRRGWADPDTADWERQALPFRVPGVRRHGHADRVRRRAGPVPSLAFGARGAPRGAHL